MRPIYSRFLPLLLFTLLSLALSAQNFGGNPPSQKWNQVNTDTVRIIFPVGMDSAANRVASIIHHLAAQKPASLGEQLRKINIVLQNQTTVGNGYVQLGPFRSEFFLTPVVNNFSEGSISWLDQLAIHEYKHVQQFNNFRNGLSKGMYYLFGEEGLALAINASVPDWFYEGDAVYNETLVTRQGRGRLPLFLNAYPSLWQANKKYSWMKLRNGSLKDYVPSHYQLGYLLVNYGREKYGMDFWRKVTHDASSFKGLFYPFQKAIKEHAGIPYKKFLEGARDYYKTKAERVSTSRDEYLIPVKKNYVTSYLFPYSIGNDSLLYLRTSYRHRPTFFIKDKDGEHRVRVKDISLDNQFSYKNGKVVYAAYETDPRWGWRDYTVIKILDLQTRRQKTLTSKTKYFTPDISDDGSRIAAVHIGVNGESELHVLDAANGKPVSRIKSSDIMLFTDPKFVDGNSLVTAVRLNDGKMALALAEISTGNTMRLTPPSFNVVGYPSVSNGFVYFTASYGGNDDVFVLRLNDRKISRVTDGPLGNYYVNAAHGKITWSAFTAEGYQLKQIQEKEVAWNTLSDAGWDSVQTKFNVSHSPAATNVVLNAVSARQFPVTKYRKSTGLLNFHSWRPYYEDPIFTYSIYGENILNTLQTELYYLYNQDERTSAVGVNATYSALFPHITAGTEFTFDRTGGINNRLRIWNQLDTRVGLNIPLSITSGRTFKNLNVGSYYVLRNQYFRDSSDRTSFSYLLHALSWSQQVQGAVQHIFPRWAWAFSFNHRHAITTYEGYQFIGNLSLYVPGAFSTHSLVLSGSLQQRDTLSALFSTRFAGARGYADYYRTTAGSRMWRLSANYHLPLWLPDWGFGNILYLQRFRGNIFYDMQRLYSNNKLNTSDLRSFGWEIYVDTKWWNQYPLTFGFRMSHLFDRDPRGGNPRGSNLYEFILPVSIIPR